MRDCIALLAAGAMALPLGVMALAVAFVVGAATSAVAVALLAATALVVTARTSLEIGAAVARGLHRPTFAARLDRWAEQIDTCTGDD